MLEVAGGQELRYPRAEDEAAPPISRQTALTARASLLFPCRRQSGERRGTAVVGLWGGRWFTLPLCLKEFSLERTSGELRPLSLRCGDEGSFSLETSGSGSLSVMQGVMLCCLFRASGEVTPSFTFLSNFSH